jgi:hypothetical protein
MQQAQKQLGQGQVPGAQNAMEQAAQSLRQAAQQLAQQQGQQPGQQQGQQQAQQPGQPNSRQPTGDGRADGGAPDLRAFEKDLQKHGGKAWGELPGELRTRVIQDMKARYGDDYGRIIKMYFEDIADTKNRSR